MIEIDLVLLAVMPQIRDEIDHIGFAIVVAVRLHRMCGFGNPATIPAKSTA
jgi:hypothetical protein